MISSLLYDLNHALLWQRQLCVWDRNVRAASLDRLLFLGLHRLGWMGEQEESLLRTLIKPGIQIVDVGANIGLYSLLLAKLTGENGQVYSFEPEQSLFATLVHNCAANNVTNVVPFQYAAGSSNGRAAFAPSAFNSGNNTLTICGTGSVEVELVRIDDVLSVTAVDFIKVDVQGHELAALGGLKRILTASTGVRVMFEFWPAGLRAAQTEPQALLNFLSELDFTIYSTEGCSLRKLEDSTSLIQKLGSNGYTNLLASRTTVQTP